MGCVCQLRRRSHGFGLRILESGGHRWRDCRGSAGPGPGQDCLCVYCVWHEPVPHNLCILSLFSEQIFRRNLSPTHWQLTTTFISRSGVSFLHGAVTVFLRFWLKFRGVYPCLGCFENSQTSCWGEEFTESADLSLVDVTLSSELNLADFEGECSVILLSGTNSE